VILSAAEQRHYHAERDPHVAGRWLSDLILGAQDGVVNTIGVVLGIASATSDARIVLAAGTAAAVAQAISMAAVAYTSSAARGDLFRAERAREYRHIERAPVVEREEVRAMFAAKGFAGELLDRAVDVVCENKDVWVAMMMAEEHALNDVDRRASLRSSAVVGGASLTASLAAVVPFGFTHGAVAIGLAMGASTLLLFMLGALKARLTTGSAGRSGLALAGIGVTSALAAYAVAAAVTRLL
jgi:vacuolar iron transporter family protein